MYVLFLKANEKKWLRNMTKSLKLARIRIRILMFGFESGSFSCI